MATDKSRFASHTLVGGWTTEETLASNTHGTLKGKINKGLKIGIVKWTGNDATPNNNEYTIPVDSKYTPDENYITQMWNGNMLGINRTFSHVVVRLSNAAYSNAYIVYPLLN